MHDSQCCVFSPLANPYKQENLPISCSNHNEFCVYGTSLSDFALLVEYPCSGLCFQGRILKPGGRRDVGTLLRQPLAFTLLNPVFALQQLPLAFLSALSLFPLARLWPSQKCVLQAPRYHIDNPCETGLKRSMNRGMHNATPNQL